MEFLLSKHIIWRSCLLFMFHCANNSAMRFTSNRSKENMHVFMYLQTCIIIARALAMIHIFGIGGARFVRAQKTFCMTYLLVFVFRFICSAFSFAFAVRNEKKMKNILYQGYKVIRLLFLWFTSL